MAGMSAAPDAIVPDTKDWTWVLERPCPECGFDPAAQSLDALPTRIHDTAMAWSDVLARLDVDLRPTPAVWSPLEYACHVRDVCRVFTERVDAMLRDDGTAFPNWDQDATAVAARYHEQDPAMVAAELRDAASDVRDAFASVGGEQWQRTGVRSDGSVFTVETLGQYFLHDLAHHLVDVRA